MQSLAPVAIEFATSRLGNIPRVVKDWRAFVVNEAYPLGASPCTIAASRARLDNNDQ